MGERAFQLRAFAEAPDSFHGGHNLASASGHLGEPTQKSNGRLRGVPWPFGEPTRPAKVFHFPFLFLIHAFTHSSSQSYMTQRKTSQQESSPKTKILAVLMLLRNTYGMTGREIAGMLGVNENYLSRVFNGKELGSNQLAAALEMLLELTKIRREQEEAELQKKLSDGTLTVADKVKLLKRKGKL